VTDFLGRPSFIGAKRRVCAPAAPLRKNLELQTYRRCSAEYSEIMEVSRWSGGRCEASNIEPPWRGIWSWRTPPDRNALEHTGPPHSHRAVRYTRETLLYQL